jgi:hypothetical protein
MKTPDVLNALVIKAFFYFGIKDRSCGCGYYLFIYLFLETPNRLASCSQTDICWGPQAAGRGRQAHSRLPLREPSHHSLSLWWGPGLESLAFSPAPELSARAALPGPGIPVLEVQTRSYDGQVSLNAHIGRWVGCASMHSHSSSARGLPHEQGQELCPRFLRHISAGIFQVPPTPIFSFCIDSFTWGELPA